MPNLAQIETEQDNSVNEWKFATWISVSAKNMQSSN